MSASFEIERLSLDGVEIVNVSGELDHATAPRLREALDEALAVDGSPVVVDMSDCGFIDSTGLGLLLESQRRLVDADRRFGICCARGEVIRLLELTGIDSAVVVFATRDDALSRLGASP